MEGGGRRVSSAGSDEVTEIKGVKEACVTQGGGGERKEEKKELERGVWHEGVWRIAWRLSAAGSRLFSDAAAFARMRSD